MTVITRIAERRAAGKTTCITMPIAQSGSHATIADHVVQAHGFRALGEGWLEISAADAHMIVTALLHRDLAFLEELMPMAEASEFATAFLDLAPEPHSYFTNGEWSMATDTHDAEATLEGWDPISDAAFDAGVVCVGDGVAALLWVEDEE